MNDNKIVFRQFNETYFNLLEFFKKYSDGDKIFSRFYQRNYIMKKTNIKMFIKYWYENITSSYYEQINEGNINFFLEKDYNREVNKMNDLSFNISSYIDFFRNKYHQLDTDIIQNFIGQVQILNNLSYYYYKK
jgi:hypothetical protein